MSAEVREAAAELGLGDRYANWLAVLDLADGVDGAETPVCSRQDADTLTQLGVTEQDAAVVLATQPELERSQGLRWLLRQCRRIILAHLGDPVAPLLPLPQLPAELGAAGRCFPAHLFLATLPGTLAWQQRRGIPASVCWPSFLDLGRHMQIYRETHGMTGVDEPWWLMLHLQGLLYEFRRLQFNLLRIGSHSLSPASWYDETTASRMGPGFRPGDDAVGVHIPEAGPLDPQACAASLAAARSFFPRYFPSPTRKLAICESWLLDDQLRAYLAASANIVVFQRQFTLAPGWKPGDKDVAQFVFRRAVDDLGGVPQRTTLQRAVISHLRTGGHWRVRCGWLPL